MTRGGGAQNDKGGGAQNDKGAAAQSASLARRPATEEIGREKQMAPALLPGPACRLTADIIAAFSSRWATI